MWWFLLGLVIGCSGRSSRKENRDSKNMPTITDAFLAGFMKSRLQAEEKKMAMRRAKNG